MKVGYFDSEFTRDIQQSFANFCRQATDIAAFRKFCDVRNTTEYTSNINSTEGIKEPSWVNESQQPVQHRLEKGYKTTLVSREFAHQIVLSYKARVKARDSKERLSEYIAQERDAAIFATYQFMEKEAHRMLNFATTNTYYVAPDGLSLINAAHTWNSSTATFSNIMSSAPLTAQVVDAAMAYGGAFTDAQGLQMPLSFDTIVVRKGGAASRAALKLFGRGTSDQYMATTIGGVNIYFGEMTIIETPYLSNSNAYFFMDLSGKYANPLRFDIVDFPGVQDLIPEANGDFVYPIFGSVKIGIQNAPFNILYNA